MGKRKREHRLAVHRGEVQPFVLANGITCAGGCGRRIPLAALHHNHGLPEWCGAVSLGGGKVLCPTCADSPMGKSYVDHEPDAPLGPR